jgi:hypothetical protein
MSRRLYGFCAKGGEAKGESTGYVCATHSGPGLYRFCAHCGKAWKAESRDYVCEDCLVQRVAS